MSRIIEIKKSQVAYMRGLDYTTQRMATHFGITEKEMKEALIEFGFIKARKPKVEPEYVVQYVNDVFDEPTTEEPVITSNTVVYTTTESTEKVEENA